ncbi:MAG: ATP-dependent helicase HrpB [Candidatus Sumerlaeia bacterium]|nr:ATP-dependent helicase HrpB [Candidatus Sumerlaeia bacterium]
MTPLPIDDVLPQVLEALRGAPGCVVVAPPGAGKTTRIPPAIVEAGPLSSEHPAVVMLQPRRIAARAAATRIAHERGWTVGQQVGWHIRHENRTRRETRVRVLTEGILTRRLLADPFLDGVGCVILDEFHERSLHADLALALLRDVQQGVRPDLRLVVMSATMNPSPVAAFLGNVPVIESAGHLHPVEVSFAPPSSPRTPVWETMAAAVRRMLAAPPAESGHLLVFLPGMREIRRTAERLGGCGASVHLLHSSVAADEQDRALAPSRERKVVLATNIAETSLTIDGVRTVIDSGLARVPVHDVRLGIDRLETRRISRASADQRTGRAGRTASGRCLRLWSPGEDAALDEAEAPEIHRLDLAATLLSLKAWGITDAAAFGWFEAPRAEAIERAEHLLALLGATDADGRPTELGEILARLPLHPRLGALLVHGARAGVAHTAAGIAAMLAESDGRFDNAPAAHHDGTSDVLERLEQAARTRVPAVERLRSDLLRAVREEVADAQADDSREGSDVAVLRVLLRAWPDRVTRRRGHDATRGVMVGRRGVVLDSCSVVRRGELFLSLDPRDVPGEGESRVALASLLRCEWLSSDLPAHWHERLVHRYDTQREAVVTILESSFLDLVVDERMTGPQGDPEGASRTLVEALGPRAPALFAEDESAARLLARVRLLARAMPELALPAWDDAALAVILRDACEGATSLADVRAIGLANLLRAALGHRHQQALDQHAPEHLALPGGRRVRLDYDPDPVRPPVLAARVQHFFGSTHTPRIAAGRVPVLLHLLAPNGRPVQVTQDLEGFWSRTYPQVRKELRARYPRHAWPENPNERGS